MISPVLMGRQEIKNLPGTRSAHCFEAVELYVIRCALHSSLDVSEMGRFSFTTGRNDQTTDCDQ